MEVFREDTSECVPLTGTRYADGPSENGGGRVCANAGLHALTPPFPYTHMDMYYLGKVS